MKWFTWTVSLTMLVIAGIAIFVDSLPIRATVFAILYACSLVAWLRHQLEFSDPLTFNAGPWEFRGSIRGGNLEDKDKAKILLAIMTYAMKVISENVTPSRSEIQSPRLAEGNGSEVGSTPATEQTRQLVSHTNDRDAVAAFSGQGAKCAYCNQKTAKPLTLQRPVPGEPGQIVDVHYCSERCAELSGRSATSGAGTGEEQQQDKRPAEKKQSVLADL